MDERTLRQMVEDHERRIANLEARLDPKTREQATAAALDDLLDELAGKDPTGGAGELSLEALDSKRPNSGRLGAKTRAPATVRGKLEEKDPAGGLFDDLPKEISELEF